MICNQYELASIPLVQLDAEKKPIGHASGCLLKYKERVFILTVAHATENQGDWAIQMGYERPRETRLYRLGAMNFLARGRIKEKKLHDIDFSYKLLSEPLTPMHQVVNDSGEILFETQKTIIVSDLTTLPDSEQKYGFYGLTRQGLEGTYLRQVQKLETGMQYIKNRRRLSCI